MIELATPLMPKQPVTQIPVEKDVPLPEQRPPSECVRPPGRMSYPWQALEPGWSFFVPGVKPSGMTANVRDARAKYGHAYTTRTEVVGGIKGVRVWRIK